MTARHARSQDEGRRRDARRSEAGRPADTRAQHAAEAVRASEARSRAALARLAGEVARLGPALDERLQRVEAGAAAKLREAAAELDRLEQRLGQQLSAFETGQADALEALRREVLATVDRLSERLAQAERGAEAAVAGLSRRLDDLSDEVRAGDSRLAADLDARLAESQRRTERLIAGLRVEFLQRDAAAFARQPSQPPAPATRWPGLMLALSGAAGAAALAVAGYAVLATSAPPPEPSPVILPLPPLRPALDPELPPAPEVSRAARSPDRGRGAPAAPPENYPALARAIGQGDRSALGRLQALAQSGVPAAQLLLAKAYEDGRAGLPKDLAEARRWTERAALGGERSAMHNLAIYYMTGEGGPPDAPAAARWFHKAADAGVVDAQFNLALLYENGRGVAKNLGEAYRWYAIAANAGDGLARGRAVALEGRLTRHERAAATAQAGGFAPGRTAPRTVIPVVPPAETVAQSQQMLAREGYFIGATDGTDSDGYRAAVAAYLGDHPQARRPAIAP